MKGFGLAVLYQAGGLMLLHIVIQRARQTGMLLRLSE
jgi:hypothetical protein